MPFGPPAPAPARATCPPLVAITGVRNALARPAVLDGVWASTTPVPDAVRPDPNGPFMVTAQDAAVPLASTAAKPVDPRSRGKAPTPNPAKDARAALLIAAPGSRVARRPRERLSITEEVKAPAPVREPGSHVTKLPVPRERAGPCKAVVAASSCALMPPPCAADQATMRAATSPLKKPSA